ncbi:hypothetical protein Scep_015231 [Stephania cephalantha]|uniref:Transmembrane 9 superfamily member n=1 Tax=Stephania cephalantha TaxID=152367 RepID=A0AAP0P2L6_9MAGN
MRPKSVSKPIPVYFPPFLTSSALFLSLLATATTAMADEIRFRRVALLFIIVITVFAMRFQISRASQYDHRYAVGEDVPLYVAKVGPLNNPRSPLDLLLFNLGYLFIVDLVSLQIRSHCETYRFYDLPFCSPDQLTEKEESLREVLNGDRLTNSLYELKFRVVKIMETLCNKNLTIEEVAKFRHAVHNNFYFKMLYDSLPLWGFIGKVKNFKFSDEPTLRYYLFTHVEFDVLYNEDQVIEVEAHLDPNYAVDITEDAVINVEFMYSVLWEATSTPFEKRVETYMAPSVFHKNQWFQLFKPLLFFILAAIIVVIHFIWILKKDIMRCSLEDGNEGDVEENGWCLLHRDVFRYPCFASLFCAILGTGMQLLISFCFLFLLAFLGFFPPFNQGLVNALTITTYALTSVVAGFTAASFQALMKGTKGRFVKTILLAGFLYTGPLLLTFSLLNMMAIYYRATTAIPIGTILVIFLIWLLVAVPLLILGGFFGNAFRLNILSSDATKRVPSEIPPLAWYMRSPSHICLAGFILYFPLEPELYYVYESFWSVRIYYVLTISVIIKFIILVLVTAMLGICLTFLQLCAKDHRWWWRSVLNGGSASVFMFCRSLVFYARSNMSGLMQLAFFVGYNACICFAFFLMLGTISFFGSAFFVHHLYRVAKLEHSFSVGSTKLE